MRKPKLLHAMLLMLSALCAQPSDAGEAPDAKETLRVFYEHYLNYHYQPGTHAPTPQFSSSFKKEMEKSAAVCKKNAGSDICGWSADGDPYLNAQDMADHLNYSNSGIQLTEPKRNYVSVTLNVFPDTPISKKNTLRMIDYRMVFENGVWVVDDIVLHSGDKNETATSTRETMRTETSYYLNHPQAKAK